MSTRSKRSKMCGTSSAGMPWPASATQEDIKGFLSDLAVRWRVSVATQEQALNALVFLFREARGQEPGDLSGYDLSRRGHRLPTVLTRQGCGKLFAGRACAARWICSCNGVCS